jgi:thymidylate synthase
MKWPVNDYAKRKLGYKFMCAEAWWIMTGQNRLDSIKAFSESIGKFSDDGEFFFGAYGPRVVDQLMHITKSLTEDHASRQAVLTTWRPNPPSSKDIPCTISLQFIIRDGKLDCLANMRSSDAWLGVPYDWFNFSMLSGGICILLRKAGQLIELGTLHFYAGSQHLYEHNFEAVKDIIRDNSLPAIYLSVPFKPHEFKGYRELTDHLLTLAHVITESGYLAREMKDYYANKTKPE